jgi:alkylation response protein AidB-like acyl-CoA dehydrogenase
MRTLLDSTVEYSKQRKQFGLPIGSFQVLQHRMADMFVHLEQSVSMTYLANIRVSDGDARSISAAKARVGKACRFIGESAVQIHGGMGMTEEMPVSHYFKRAVMIENSFGSIDHHLARFERLASI